MKAEQRKSVACKTAEAERTSEKACATSSDVWSSFIADIQRECLKQNFGTLSKSEFDLLVFHYYLLDKQAQVGPRYVTDYEIGRELGLTIQRVRSLREREALKWEETRTDWKKSFLNCIPLARRDGENVKIPIPDVNVIKEVRNYLEMAGLFDDYQLNPKVFQCNLELLVAICLEMESNGDDKLRGEIVDKLRGSKDRTVARAVEEQAYPKQAVAQKTVIKIVRDTIALFPGIGNACGEVVAQFLEKLR